MEFTTSTAKTVKMVVNDMVKMSKTLPKRPELEEIEAAKMLISNVDREIKSKLEVISGKTKGQEVAEELFFVYLEMRKSLIQFQSKEQKREAVEILDLENAHQVFDGLIQRAFDCVSPNNGGEISSGQSVFVDKMVGFGGSSSFSSKEGLMKREMLSRDDTYVGKSVVGLNPDGIGSSSVISAEKMSMIKLASLIELSANKGTEEFNLSGKLSDQVDWLPDSIGKLSCLITLDLSENRIVVLPKTIAGLSSLSKLDLHANRINELPESIGELLNLVFLDLRGNDLVRLPPSIGRLIRLQELDLSSNGLLSLPDTIESLVNLKKLNLETNDLEELPHTIGQCSSLQELRVDYNRIKALPEAVGNIESLEILSVRYNNIRLLPSTMHTLRKLRELDVSFNELEAVPERLCLVTSLVRLNVSNNFADLRSLPRSIGNLEMLEYLDISNNQIRVLPDSFRSLSRLSQLHVDQNPLEVPPREIADKGAKDVVQYMTELVASREAQPTKQKKTWACCFPRSFKRNSRGMDHSTT